MGTLSLKCCAPSSTRLKKRFGTYGKEKEALPLEGGGKRVGVKGVRSIAKGLRKQSTDTERQLWRYLRNRQIEGFKFRGQQPIGSYIVDFVDLGKKVMVELIRTQEIFRR